MAATLLDTKINGVSIPIVFEQDNHLPLTTIEFIFKNSGALASSKAGLVTLSADLLNEGTKKDGSLLFAKELEDRAITLSANSGAETFVFSIEALKSELPYGIKKLKELLKDPNLTDKTFEKIQKKRLANLIRKKDDFDYIASNGLKGILFKDTNLALPRLGTKESIESITLDDIKEFIHKHLLLNNLIVVAAGDLKKEEIKNITKELTTILKQGESPKIQKITTNNKPKEKEQKEETKQAYIYFGAPYNMEMNSPKRYIGKIASYILGAGGFGSRLMEEIRVKKGLAYSAYCRFIVNKTSSYFTGYLQTKLESQQDAIKSVNEVVDNFVKNGATKEELESAKKFFLGSEPLRTETLNQRANRAFNEYYSELGLGYSKKELKYIENLTLDQLNSFIKDHQEILKMSFFIVTNR